MKCDVCGCKVSKRDLVCPNCGYQLRKNINTVNDTSEGYNNSKTIKKARKANSTNRMSGKIILFFSALLILGIILFSPKNIEDMKFEEVIEENRDDQYGSVKTAIENRNRMIDHIYDKGFVYFDIREYIYEYNDYLTAISYIYIGKPEYTYSTNTIVIVNSKGECSQCYIEDSCEKNDFPSKDVESFSELLGYDSVLKELQAVEGPLEQRYEYKSNKISLYVLESANGPDVHYRISFNGIDLDPNSMY